MYELRTKPHIKPNNCEVYFTLKKLRNYIQFYKGFISVDQNLKTLKEIFGIGKGLNISRPKSEDLKRSLALAKGLISVDQNLKT